MSPEIALYAAAIATALVGIGSLLKALRASRSQGYELFSDSEEGTGDSRGTGDSGGTGAEDEPLAHQTFVIPLAFNVMLAGYLLLLAHSKPTWQMIMKAGLSIFCILCQIMISVWTPIKNGRIVVSLMLNMWMLGMPFVQCQWWLFAVSIATCTFSAVVLHYADLDKDKHCYGLAASLMAAWMVALTMLSTWRWAFVLLTTPSMIGFYWIPSRIKGLELGDVNPFFSTLLLLYLIWSMPLPLLSSASWQLPAVMLFAAFAGTALLIAASLVDDGFQGRVNVLEMGLFGVVPLVIATLLPLAVVWWSGQVPQVLETVPPWMLRLGPVTFGAMYILMEVVYVNYMSVKRRHPRGKEVNANAFGQTAVMTRILVLLILLATPWALALDTAQLQQWGQSPNLYLPDYLTLQFGKNETWQKIETWHLPNATWHNPKANFLHMTQPTWPDLATTTSSMARAKFWVPFIVIKLFGATVFATLVLGIPCSKGQMQQDERVGDGRSQNQLKDVQRTSITICLVVANLVVCTKLTLTASMAGQLTSGGMVWEGFDEILSWGLLWLMAQAMALRLLNCGAAYAAFDVALSALFVFPYLGDPFDTLKDAMLASVAIQSDVLWLGYLGIAGMIYLWVLHLCVLLPVKSSRLELQSSYLPVLLLKPTRTGSKFAHSWWVKLCAVMYKQCTPTKQKAMLAEDLPQALLACLVSMSSKGSMFTVVTNIAIPVARLTFAALLQDSLAEIVKDWLLEQAVEALCHDRVEASNEFTIAMSRLAQVTGKDDIWESDLLQESKDRLDQKLEQVEPLREDVESLEKATFFPVFLQLLLTFKGLEQGTEDSQSKALDTFVNLLKTALKDPSWQGICRQVSTWFGPKLIAIGDLNLRGGKINGDGVATLADAISHLTAITEMQLSLAWCNMSREGCKAVANSFFKLTNLQELELDFDGNDIGVEGAETLAGSMSHLTAITKLDLRLLYCKIASKGCKAVAAGLSKLTNIQKLTLALYGNNISDEGCRALAECLPELQELVELRLDLTWNSVSPVAGAALEEAAAKLPRLTVKDIKFS